MAGERGALQTARTQHILLIGVFALHALTFSTLLTLVVLAGLLTFPTECRCGDEPPHPHALYLLPGHYHEDGGAVDDHSSRTQRDTELPAQDTGAQSGSGPQLQALETLSPLGEPSLMTIVAILSGSPS